MRIGFSGLSEDATSCGWKIEKSKTVPWYEESSRSLRGACHGECSGAPIRKYRIACHLPAKRVMSSPALTGRTPAVGDSGGKAAAAGPPPRRALCAVRAHGAELLAEGLFRTGLREPGYGGMRWKWLIGYSPSWQSGATSRPASSTAGCTPPLGARRSPIRGVGHQQAS